MSMKYVSLCEKAAKDIKVGELALENGLMHKAELETMLSQLRTDKLKANRSIAKTTAALEVAKGILTDNTNTWLSGVQAAENALRIAEEQLADIIYTETVYQGYIDTLFS